MFCIDNKLHTLLEGPTGTSKTFSAQVTYEFLKYLDDKNNNGNKYKDKKFIRYNLSSETKIDDLLSQYVGEENSPAGLKLIDGPFFEAFTKGYTFLLDEINLASKSVLESIQEAIGSGILSIPISGKGLYQFEQHKDFCLIATQNPNKGAFKNKRQDLGIDFLSRFCKVNFEIDKNELQLISYGLAKEFGFIKENMDENLCKTREKIIEELVNFHLEWITNHVSEDDVQCFTIREISKTVETISKDNEKDNNNIYDIIFNIYGARYTKEKKNELLDVLSKKCTSLNNNSNKQKRLDEEFPFCFVNNNLVFTINQCLFSLNNGRNIIISSKKGNGKSEVAKMVSKFYDYKNKIEKKGEYFCICTQKIEPSDIIGSQRPPDEIQKENKMLVWKPGFLTEGVKNGWSVILDNIEEASSIVSERLNGLLDINYREGNNKFDIPENPNPKENQIDIKPSFRLICTCDINQINKMSPSFVNRFDVIVLEDQLEEIKEKELIELIATRMIIENESKNDINLKVPDCEDFMTDDDDDDDIKNNKEKDKDINEKSDVIEKKENDGENNIMYKNVDIDFDKTKDLINKRKDIIKNQK